MGKGISVVFVLVMGLALAAAAAFGEETIYRWVDKEGNVHFGGRPPAGVEATVVTPAYQPGGLDPQPSAEAAEPNPARQEPSPAELQRQERSKRRQAVLDERRLIQQNCASMRRQRDELEPRTNVLVMGEDGEPVRLDDEARLARLAEAKAYLAEHCD